MCEYRPAVSSREAGEEGVVWEQAWGGSAAVLGKRALPPLARCAPRVAPQRLPRSALGVQRWHAAACCPSRLLHGVCCRCLCLQEGCCHKRLLTTPWGGSRLR